MQIINILDYINTAGCNCVTAGRAVGSRHSVKLIFSSFIDLNFFSFFFTVNFVLPPTPPSSASSDSEGNVSPVRDVTSPKSDESQRRSSTSASSSNRHPINSPLISYQAKGSTGVLQLTEEEKRTLIAEGYPVPTRLPLTKAEEKSLKKIRRKIKNKISAQESRRKKKEYMDTLERRSQELVDENADYRQRLVQLETDNAALQLQLKRLQKLLNLSHQHDLPLVHNFSFIHLLFSQFLTFCFNSYRMIDSVVE